MLLGHVLSNVPSHLVNLESHYVVYIFIVLEIYMCVYIYFSVDDVRTRRLGGARNPAGGRYPSRRWGNTSGFVLDISVVLGA